MHAEAGAACLGVYNCVMGLQELGVGSEGALSMQQGGLSVRERHSGAAQSSTHACHTTSAAQLEDSFVSEANTCRSRCMFNFGAV